MVSTTHQSADSLEKKIDKIQKGFSREVKIVAHGAGSIVVLEFILGLFMVAAGVPIPGLGFAVNIAVAILLIFIRLYKPSEYICPNLSLFAALFILALTYVSIVSTTVGVSTTDDVLRRAFRIAVIFGIVLLIADKRINFKSLMLGLGIGMVINAIAFYLGIAPAAYGDALTGWMGDKNVAGMYYGVIPIILFGLFEKQWHRLLIVALTLPLLFETGSRTSMGGFILGVLWILFARKVSLVVKIFLGFAFAWLFEWMQSNFADSSVFGDRSGTDWYREQIDIASWAKTEEAPWHGLGFGQAIVILPNGEDMYFHNSYWTLLVEGGWPWAIAILGVTFYAVFVWKQAGQRSSSERNLTAEAATVFLAVCSWRLGEVMLTIPWAFAVGYALSLTALPKKNILSYNTTKYGYET